MILPFSFHAVPHHFLTSINSPQPCHGRIFFFNCAGSHLAMPLLGINPSSFSLPRTAFFANYEMSICFCFTFEDWSSTWVRPFSWRWPCFKKCKFLCHVDRHQSASAQHHKKMGECSISVPLPRCTQPNWRPCWCRTQPSLHSQTASPQVVAAVRSFPPQCTFKCMSSVSGHSPPLPLQSGNDLFFFKPIDSPHPLRHGGSNV